MAYYQAQIIPTALDDPAADPTQHLWPFLSAQLQAWANLCSSHVTLLAGENEYTGSRNNSATHYLVVELKSDAQVSGIDTGTTQGFSFRHYSYIEVFSWRDHTPSSSYSGAGDFGYRKRIDYNTAFNHNSSSTWTEGYETKVWYCDTPGQRFFAWDALGGHTNSSLYSYGIFELQGTSHNDQNENAQWVWMNLYRDHSSLLVRSEDEDAAALRTPYTPTSETYGIDPNYFPFDYGSTSLLKNVSVFSDAGHYAGYIPEESMLSGLREYSPRAIEYNGRYYRNPAGGSRVWLREY